VADDHDELVSILLQQIV